MDIRKWLVAGLAMCVGVSFADEELVRNGDFEAGFATASTWGSYANGGSKYSNPNWTVEPTNKGGLGKPMGTWMASGLAVGNYALFLQTTDATNPARAYQGIGVSVPGKYRVAFNWTGRPSHLGQKTTVTLGEHVVAQVQASGTALMSESAEVVLTEAGPCRLNFESIGSGTSDQANVFDAVSVQRVEEGDLEFPADARLVWTAPCSTLSMTGTITFSGATKLVAYGTAPGTYTLCSASAIVLADGATVTLDESVQTDNFARTLTVSETAVTLTVARVEEPTEYVVNGSFDLPGASFGASTETYGYANYPGFALPWWVCDADPTTAAGMGISAAQGTWLAAGQTNGGYYSLYFQGPRTALRQDFGLSVPMGVYRLSFNVAGRPSHAGSAIEADLTSAGETAYVYKSFIVNNTVFTNVHPVVVLPQGLADAGIAFIHQHPDAADRAVVIDDVSFRSEPVAGWSLGGDGVTRLSGQVEVPHESYVDGDAELAVGTTFKADVVLGTPYTLKVKGALRVNGQVTVSLPTSLSLTEADYTLIEAGSLDLASENAFVLDSSTAWADTTYQAQIVVTATRVILRLRKWEPTKNNYWLQASARPNDRYSSTLNWSRGHVPTTGDGTIMYPYSGTVLFDDVITSPGLATYVRNGLETPVVFDASSDTCGFNDNSKYVYLAHAHNMSAWLEIRRGTYTIKDIYVNGTSNAGQNSHCRLDITGGTINLADCIQCGWSSDAESWVNVSAGTVTLTGDFNSNIAGRSKHHFTMTGGKMSMRNAQLVLSHNSSAELEVAGGEFDVRGNMSFLTSGYNNSTLLFTLSGGVVRGDILNNQASSSSTSTFLLAGGTLAPQTDTSTWLSQGTLTVAEGHAVIADTEGHNAAWCAKVQDAAGGVAYDFVKRGKGTLTFPVANTATGMLTVEDGAVNVAAAELAAGEVRLAAGATLSLENGGFETRTLQNLTLAGGSRLAVDLGEAGCDQFVPTHLTIENASAVNPILIVVSPIEIAEIAAGHTYTVLAGGVTAADLDKFVVNGIDAELSVVEGTLVVGRSTREKKRVVWTGAANDGGLWSTGDNWEGGEVPQNGDTAVFAATTGGTTSFDLAGLALGGVIIEAGAGTYTHVGTDALRITGAITNLSGQAQVFQQPVMIGVSGRTFEICTSGNIILTNTVTTAATLLKKTGTGLLGLHAAGLLTAGDVEIDEGTLRLDERTTDMSILRASEDGPYSLVVKNGARLDVNAAGTGKADLAVAEAVHKYTIFFEGDGPDGQGALYNSAQDVGWGSFFSHLVLTGDASVGGYHLSVRAIDGSSNTDLIVEGPYQLTVKSPAYNYGFNFHTVHFELDSLAVVGKIQFEGNITGVITNGVQFVDNTVLALCSATVPPEVPITIADGASVQLSRANGAGTVNSDFTVGSGATLTFSSHNYNIVFNAAFFNGGTVVNPGGNVYYRGTAMTGGTFQTTGSHTWFTGAINAPEANITISGAGPFMFGDENTNLKFGLPTFGSVTPIGTIGNTRFMPMVSTTVSNSVFDAVVANTTSVDLDSFNEAAVLTLKNATWTLQQDFYLGRYSRPGKLVIGEGATMTVPGLVYIANETTSPGETYLEIAQGGTFNWTPPAGSNGFQFGRGVKTDDTTLKPSRVKVTGGTFNAADGIVLVGVDLAYAYLEVEDGVFNSYGMDIRHRNSLRAKWGKAHDERYRQTGGTINLGGRGFYTSWLNWLHPHADLKNGLLCAAADTQTRHTYISAAFGESPTDRGTFTIDPNEHTIAWNAPLMGASDVAIRGTGTFKSDRFRQSIPEGKWTVGANVTADLSGAAGFAGGLELEAGAQANINIAGEALFACGFFNLDQFSNFAALRTFPNNLPFLVNTIDEVHRTFATEAEKPMGNSVFCVYKGQFYVSAAQAGTWYFAGAYDDGLALDIDGVTAIEVASASAQGVGQADLSEGWHDFTLYTRDGTGARGPTVAEWKAAGMALGFSTEKDVAGVTNPKFFTRFDSHNLKMRAPQGAGWRTGARLRVLGALGSGNTNTYMNDDLIYLTNDTVVTSLKTFNAKAGNAAWCGTNMRLEGAFYVPAENEGTWTITGQYDDRITIYIDGTKVVQTAAYNVPVSGTATLSVGWHAFRFDTMDGSTAAGTGYGGMLTDDNGVSCAVLMTPANSTQKLAFIEDNFRIAANVFDSQKWYPAGLGGVVKLGAGASLANDSTSPDPCPIYGTLAGAGALDGAFAFTGEANAWRVVGGGAAARLTEVVDTASVVNGDFLAGLKTIEAQFPDAKPISTSYRMGSAFSLTAADAAAIEVRATGPNGEELEGWSAAVVGGKLVLRNPHPAGLTFIIR